MAAQCVLAAAYFLRVSICTGNFCAFTGNSMGKALPSAQFGSFFKPKLCHIGQIQKFGAAIFIFTVFSHPAANMPKRIGAFITKSFRICCVPNAKRIQQKNYCPCHAHSPFSKVCSAFLATTPNRSEASAYISGGAMLSLCVRLAITPQIEAALSPKACATTNSVAVSIS